ncbi:MAG: hypothetical protein Crog4KO_36520 [Crocinitomicaceae bacterium]
MKLIGLMELLGGANIRADMINYFLVAMKIILEIDDDPRILGCRNPCTEDAASTFCR